MSNDKSDSQFVHEESPPPAYVASATLQQPHPTSHNDNVILRALSHQAFEAEHSRDGAMLIPREEKLLTHPLDTKTALLV